MTLKSIIQIHLGPCLPSSIFLPFYFVKLIEYSAPTWPFTQAAVHWVDAGLCLQSAGRRLGEVATEAGVTGLAGQPLQGGVGEGRHVLPAPVRHVDLPQPHPGRHCGFVLQTHNSTPKSKQGLYTSCSLNIHHPSKLDCDKV